MSAIHREIVVCCVCLFIVSLCVTYVQPFVLDGKPEVLNKSSDLFMINPSDIGNVLTPNGLHSNELQETGGMEYIELRHREKTISYQSNSIL